MSECERVFSAPYNPTAPAINAGRIENILRFPLNTERKKPINIKTTDICGDLSLNVNGASVGLFTVSVGSVTRYAAAASTGHTVYC